MRTEVHYRRATLVCRWNYWANGPYDPWCRVARQEMGFLPCWELRGEDGTRIGVCREVDELSAFVERPGEKRRVAYGDGDRCDGPIVARDANYLEPSALEIRVMNMALLPHVLERPWAELEAEAIPCDHSDDFCVLNPNGWDAREAAA